MRSLVVLLSLILAGVVQARSPQPARWSEQTANTWYANQPWLVGSNYIPATAINQLEMWQTETFDAARIDLELGWAESLGMNTMRVFLHDLLWQQDSEGFKNRIGTFLQIAQRHHIKPLFVLFDSCWDPNPHLGKQQAPRPGVHNSGWVQSPSLAALKDPSQYPRLEAYVKGVVGAFAKDDRVLGWDIWNEPPNVHEGSDAASAETEKARLVQALLPRVFAWARAAGPTQPLTSGVFEGGWSDWKSVPPTSKIQIEQSDILSFHTYDSPEEVQRRIESLQSYRRPVVCTEYMARSHGSTFQNTMPVLKRYHVGAINWGLVQGKTQTIYPWDSWQKPYEHEPTPWFHDVFRLDGSPYDPKEVEFIREMTGFRIGAGSHGSAALGLPEHSGIGV